MGRYERWNTLLEMLADRGRLDVEETARDLDVSAATIRRDFDQLAQQQMLTRTRGGAVASAIAYDLPLRYKTSRRAPEKQRIGVAAAALVKAGHVVGFNGGTTTSEVARALGARADLHDHATETGVTIVTNALNIANELTVRPHVKIVLTGGVARTQSYELIGPLSRGVLENISLDLVVLGVDAVNVTEGASAHNEGEASINELLASRAERIVIVADSSKLGQHAFAKICGVNGFDVLVTDVGAEKETVDAFAEAGVEVITV